MSWADQDRIYPGLPKQELGNKKLMAEQKATDFIFLAVPFGVKMDVLLEAVNLAASELGRKVLHPRPGPADRAAHARPGPPSRAGGWCRITLRGANAQDTTVLRRDLVKFYAYEYSLMPEGSKDLSNQDLADLIEFLYRGR